MGSVEVRRRALDGIAHGGVRGCDDGLDRRDGAEHVGDVRAGEQLGLRGQGRVCVRDRGVLLYDMEAVFAREGRVCI